MIHAFGADDVRAAEAPLLAAERGFAGGLMDRAATALAVAVLGEVRRARGRVAGARVVGLVGAGNNGGDTLHALARLARRGVVAEAILTAATAHEGGLAAFRTAGGRAFALAPDGPEDPSAPPLTLAAAAERAAGADVVLDGLLGIGARGPLRGPVADLVTRIGGARVVAVDVPSGIGVDDGQVAGPVLPAALTVTFGAVKPGLLLPPAAHLVGRLQVVDLGLQPDAAPAVARLTPADVAARWPVPGPGSHKYTRGVLGVLAGSRTYPGAAVLTVAGALGAGVGMVRHVGSGVVGRAVLAAHPEALVEQALGDRVQAWVAGPGLDASPRTVARVAQVLAAGGPTVLDAGALDALAALPALTDSPDATTPPGPRRLAPSVVLTPHAGELARLLAALGADVDRAGVEAEPARWAHEAHVRTGATVLLKGAVTVVAGPRTFAQADAPPWLATAGAGDVLAGILGALLAGRAEGALADPGLPGELAAAAALVHGRAAHLANPGGPVSASAVAAAVPVAVTEILAAAR